MKSVQRTLVIGDKDDEEEEEEKSITEEGDLNRAEDAIVSLYRKTLKSNWNRIRFMSEAEFFMTYMIAVSLSNIYIKLNLAFPWNKI